ncbi:hypothetical protein M0804_009507 [Polistes exclamans]|nr:hypothetical protein M0804_009507 [Polistes exclamans]
MQATDPHNPPPPPPPKSKPTSKLTQPVCRPRTFLQTFVTPKTSTFLKTEEGKIGYLNRGMTKLFTYLPFPFYLLSCLSESKILCQGYKDLFN